MMENDTNIVKLIIGAIAIFVVLLVVVFLFPIVIIGAGQRGVVFNNGSGVEDRILGEGLHFRTPFVESVKTLSVKVQKDEVDAQAASKDLQTVTAKIVVNWHLDADRVNKIYQSVGDEKEVIDRILIPNTNEVVKAATAKYTAEELLTKRPLLKDDVDIGLAKRLKTYNVVLDDVSIVDINFSSGFDQAIERKAQAEQDALAEKNKLESVKFQAQQKIETAKAEAESIRIKAEALAQNQELVQLNAVDKWDGKLPQYMLGGSALPFINLTR
jgi:prohibitin 1